MYLVFVKKKKNKLKKKNGLKLRLKTPIFLINTQILTIRLNIGLLNLYCLLADYSLRLAIAYI